MILPTLPTDNLYKFIALSGLVILLFSVVYPYKLVTDLELKAVEAGTQVKLLELESAAIEREIYVMEKEKEPARDEVEALRLRHEQNKINSIKIEGEQERLSVLLKQLRTAFNSLMFGVLFGCVLAYIGFYLWYVRVQRPLDKERKAGSDLRDT